MDADMKCKCPERSVHTHYRLWEVTPDGMLTCVRCGARWSSTLAWVDHFREKGLMARRDKRLKEIKQAYAAERNSRAAAYARKRGLK